MRCTTRSPLCSNFLRVRSSFFSPTSASLAAISSGDTLSVSSLPRSSCILPCPAASANSARMSVHILGRPSSIRSSSCSPNCVTMLCASSMTFLSCFSRSCSTAVSIAASSCSAASAKPQLARLGTEHATSAANLLPCSALSVLTVAPKSGVESLPVRAKLFCRAASKSRVAASSSSASTVFHKSLRSCQRRNHEQQEQNFVTLLTFSSDVSSWSRFLSTISGK